MNESLFFLQKTIYKLKFFDKKKGTIIIDDFGVNAGLEVKNPEVLKPKK